MFGGVALAEDMSASLFGVWSGTIGKSPIIACFDPDNNLNLSAYYYPTHLMAITLHGEDDGVTWIELNEHKFKQIGPTWHLKLAQPNRIVGEWTSGTQKLPIQLSRLDHDGAEFKDIGPCGSDLFMKPREPKPKIIQSQAKLDGHNYTKISVDAGKGIKVELNTFSLPGTEKAILSVNEVLAKYLPIDGKEPAYVGCLSWAMERNKSDGSYSHNFHPVVLTDHWLVAQETDESNCAPNFWDPLNDEFVFDLRSGHVVDLQDFIKSDIRAVQAGQSTAANTIEPVSKPAASSRLHGVKQAGRLPDDLLKLAWGRYSSENAECATKIGQDISVRSLTKAGMSFMPYLPYFVQECRIETVITFAELQPFLTDEGKAKLSEFQSELPK